MIIKRIYLENIRSYTKQEVNFDSGVSLLAGDIGAGKSTLLLAVDFALFGLQRGELSGSALLRNGSDSGVVEVDFSVGDNDYRIQRVLKKSSDSIVQDSGFLMINGEIEKLTTVELKQRILFILNYPADALSKKSLVYRYTVYTPQEEMKAILFSDVESRLEVIRKLFNIDKYKRILGNSRYVSSRLREKRKEIASKIYDYEEKKSRLSENENKILDLMPKLENAENLVKKFVDDVNEKKKIVERFEDDVKRFSELKKNREIFNSEVQTKLDYLKRVRNETEILKNEINAFKESDLGDINAILEKLRNLEENLKRKEVDLRAFRALIVENETKKKHGEHIKQSIIELDSCPTCKQVVSSEHKVRIESEEKETILKLDEEISRLKISEKEIDDLIINLRKDIDVSKSLVKDIQFKNSLKQEFERKKLKLGQLNLEIKNNEMRVNELNELRLKIDANIGELIDVEQNYLRVKNEFEDIRKTMHDYEMIVLSVRKDIEFLRQNIDLLKKDIETKEKLRTSIENYTRIQDFIDNDFVNLVETIEKKVMLRVHFEFNSLFSSWLSTLVNSELLTSNLDEGFTPVIRQNGYDIEYENLSGGEKTACALAYRLALNQVVNNIDTAINTKDLIILDEPTDGFSPEQLDIMKDVLSQLKMKQIIIVSHEPKIESFAEHIIRVDKVEHVSKVSYV